MSAASGLLPTITLMVPEYAKAMSAFAAVKRSTEGKEGATEVIPHMRPSPGSPVRSSWRRLQARGATADGVPPSVPSVPQRLRRHLFEKGAILW
jgi:hypothetical protein